MPEDAGTIYASIMLRLNDLQAKVSRVESLMGRVEKSSKERAKGFAGFWKNAFQTAFGVGVVQLINQVTAALRGALGVFSEYQQSIRNVQSVTGAFGEELRLIEQAAKDAGETTRFTAREAADALYFLGSAGFSAQQSIAALDGVLQLAGATQSDLASTSSTVASIISQYSLQAEDASRVSNVFAAAIGNSQATMEKLSNAFRQVGPVAAGFGLSLEQTTGALQELFNAGFRGQQAGRALKSALADLASPTSTLEKVMKKLNVSLADVNPETNELADIIDTLAESGATTADIIDAFGKVAGPQMAVLIQQGGNALREYTDAVTDTNAAAKAYEIQNDSLAGSMDFLQSKIESTAIAIFEKMEPGMRDLIDSFIKLLDAAKPLSEFLGKILNVVLRIASISVGAISDLLSAFTSGFKEMKTPMEAAGEGLEKVRKSIQKAGEFGNTAKKLNDLTDEYESLQSKTNKTQSEQDRLRSVISQIEKIMPSVVTQFDEYGNAIEVSGEKSRQAAKELLQAREANLKNAVAQLKVSESLYKRTIRQNEADAKAAEANRNRLIAQSANAEARLAVLDEFKTKYEELQGDSDALIGPFAVFEQKKTAFNSLLDDMGDRLKAVGFNFRKMGDDINSSQDPVILLDKEMRKADKTLNALQKSLSKPTRAEQLYKDSKEKLDEIIELEKQLADIQGNIADLEKIDPVDPKAKGKTDSLKTLINEFWNDYKKNIEEATKEAQIFGKEEDVLKEKLDFLKESYLDLLDKGLKPTSKTLIRIKNEYDETKEILDELIESEKEHKDTLNDKEDIQKDLVDITEKYKNKLTDLQTPEEDLIELERERAKEQVKALEGTEEATAKALEAVDNYYDELQEKSEEAKEDFKFNIEEMISAAGALADALSGLFSSITDRRIEELDRQLQAELEAAGLAEETERERLERELQAAIEAGDQERQAELENSIKRLEIEEEYERKKAQIQYQGALVEWGLKLTGAIADLSKAILVATASGPFPFNLPAIGFAVAQGINVAAIANAKPQPPAFKSGGLFLGSKMPGPTGGSMAELHGREMVLNEDQMGTLFSAISSGNIGNGNQKIALTIIYVQDSVETATQVAEVMNNGIVRLDPSRALEKV